MNKYKTEVKWALIFSAMAIAWAFIGKLSGMTDSRIDKLQLFNSLVLIPGFIIYLLALLDKKKQGPQTYKQGLISGLVLTLFVTILGTLTTFISTRLISPELFPNIIRYMVNTGQMSPEQAAQQFNLSTFIITGLIAGPVTGLIFSLVAAAFTRRK
ncbi:DUF4199 domain-containing protein [Chitinophaga niabensis]|uniref:DUF4199 domain-containing protein n=1 Tax=Chitinophaga niabensis TaxID=536979 RepID=A0A1N6G2P2_9BACT|nr:DUF4199 domain-containing protein [Chitinophaga niabensis]SIO01721.1 Protein of unknown function [Chitinophaga niabensis]